MYFVGKFKLLLAEANGKLKNNVKKKEKRNFVIHGIKRKIAKISEISNNEYYSN